MDQTCPFRLGSEEKLASRGWGGSDGAAEGYSMVSGRKSSADQILRKIALERRDLFARIRDGEVLGSFFGN